jgi:hypothetical protein
LGTNKYIKGGSGNGASLSIQGLHKSIVDGGLLNCRLTDMSRKALETEQLSLHRCSVMETWRHSCKGGLSQCVYCARMCNGFIVLGVYNLKLCRPSEWPQNFQNVPACDRVCEDLTCRCGKEFVIFPHITWVWCFCHT